MNRTRTAIQRLVRRSLRAAVERATGRVAALPSLPDPGPALPPEPHAQPLDWRPSTACELTIPTPQELHRARLAAEAAARQRLQLPPIPPRLQARLLAAIERKG